MRREREGLYFFMELTGKKQPLESYVLFSSVFKAKVPGLVLPDSAIPKHGDRNGELKAPLWCPGNQTFALEI